MRTMTIAPFIVLGAFAAASLAQNNRPAGAGGSELQWMSIPQIHDKLESAGYRSIEKIKREHGNYEVRATDRAGERVKLYLHPQTGEVVERPQRGSGREQTSSSDCNKRRCRDDLPVAK
jgi:hypothetical protein